ncbi:hypothetical protein [Aliivibrio fischeri]|uniref:hypothetical protein n=1 Tax=Aliivibrio fischeri TaxID=668 RepID=UPI0012DA999C|nr:hypothetical protein [Aliivibrio fischeri]MUJ36020.1 hypothetical protein [Aliivibrio fischeri]
MNTILPMIILTIVALAVFSYARAVIYRRNVILPKLLKLLDNDNASPAAKFMASHAFKDSLDIFLVIKMSKRINQISTENSKVQHGKFMAELDQETKEQMLEIIDNSIKLNIKLAFPVYVYVYAQIFCSHSGKSKDKKQIKKKAKSDLLDYTTSEFQDTCPA